MRQLSLGGEEATAPRAVGLTTHPERASKQNTDLLGGGEEGGSKNTEKYQRKKLLHGCQRRNF